MSDKGVTLKEIFVESQEKQNQKQLVNAFKRIYLSTSFDEFWKQLKQLIVHPFAVLAREPAVENVMDFIAKSVTHLANPTPHNTKSKGENNLDTDEEEDDQDMHPLLLKIFTFLLDIHKSKEKAVRFRVCQLVFKLLDNLGEKAQIDDDLYDRIYQCMIERLRDKFPIVRIHAVLALTRLQSPLDEACPITKAYIILMTRDSNFDVRRIVLTCLAPTKITLPSIIERTYDVKDKVRKTSYTVLAEKVPIKALTIQQRVQLLQNGLNDRSDLVKMTCSKLLLQSWLRSCEGNVLDLLALVDVQSSEKICETAVSHLFKSSSIVDLIQKFDILNDKAMIDRDKLTCESAFYWRNLLQYVHAVGTQFEEQLDQIRPNCVEYCHYVKSFAEELPECSDVDKLLDMEFILQQLLQMISVMDLSDQASRKQTEKLLHGLLASGSVGPSLIPPILQSFKLVYTDPEVFITYIAETVSDIREPITTVETQINGEARRNLDKKIAGIRVKLHQLKEELSFCIEKQDFEKAAQLKNDISALDAERCNLLGETEIRVEEVRTQKNDYFTVLKCLSIVCEVLTILQVKTFSAALQALMDSQILPGMTNVEADIRNAAVRAIGLCCLVSKDRVMQYLPILMQASQMDSTEVRATALKAMFDIFHVFGMSVVCDAVEKPKDNGTDSIIDDSFEQEEAKSEHPSCSNGDSRGGDVGGRGWGESASKVIALLSNNLDNENTDLRYIAAEGLCKLMLKGWIVSPKLLSHLLLLWYNPLVEDDAALIQILGTFFTMFAFSSSANQVVVEEAFIPTLSTVLHAPRTSPLSEINEINLANFMVEIMDSWHLSGNKNKLGIDRDNPVHDSLAVKLCNKIMSDPDSCDNKLWLHILTQLNISPDNATLIKDLLAMTEEMDSIVHDKSCFKLLEKFKEYLILLLEDKTKQATSTDKPAEVAAERYLLASESTNDAFDMTQPVFKSARKVKKSVKTPSARKNVQISHLDDCVFTPIRPSATATDVENTIIDLQSLQLCPPKTPLGRTPAGKTPKRPLFTAPDTKFTG